ncbi:actin-related protein T3 isoform X1 [Apteryx rowi]|uniref:actin-related protein T3 isoform X1 n=2 Tax=Apteryx rowi TaxID=308060 RepID=UPI000E1CED9C|nr:actin-related protein T3 isoform X1 [Apteryx rowi]
MRKSPTTKSNTMDNGSGLIKAGIAGEKTLWITYANVVGRPKDKLVAGQKECYVGNEAQARRGIISIRYPIERGIIMSGEDMEAVWKSIYDNDLQMQTSEQPVILTEAPLNPLVNREKMTELFFERFDVPALYVSIQAVLALYASGLTTGCVVDSGDGVTHSVPIFEGYCLPHGVLRLDLAGHDLTDYLTQLLRDSGASLVTVAEKQLVQNIKEKLCYVCLNLEKEMAKKPSEVEKTYHLPDGNEVKVHDQRFRCPEALFYPHNIGVEAPGIDKLCFSSIMKCDIGLRAYFYSNIILSGGSSLFPGIAERLNKEIAHMVPGDVKVKVSAPPERKFSAWVGGSILASLSAFQHMWITTTEYREAGPNIVHRKCF